jgi:site-specific DNA-methyltransferase (adenine-specific)
MTIHNHSSETMLELADGSVALTVCSPPYNVGIAYGDNPASDLMAFPDYLGMLRRVFTEAYRVTLPGGRLAVNVGNTNRRPYVPLTTHLNMMLMDIGWLMRGEIIWRKGEAPNRKASSSQGCQWGSWRSASNPVIRDFHEYILCFSKERFDRPDKGESGITAEDFMQATGSIWDMNPAPRTGHPAPFPIELPRRLIMLYSYQGDLVLDPFAGSGTTLRAAQMAGRRFVGYELVQSYAEMALLRAAPELWDEEATA